MRSSGFLKALCISFFLVSSCGGPDITSSLYRSGEVGQLKQTRRCKVLSARHVEIREEQSEDKAMKGVMAGALGGGIFGSILGGGDGAVALIGTGMGAVAGGLIGNNIGSSGRSGIEYSIILGDGSEATVLQELGKSEAILSSGSNCIIQVGKDRRNRVLSSESLPEFIQAPRTTTIVQ